MFLAQSKKNRKGGSVQQEKKLAKKWNGRVTPASGALAIKGDVHTRHELVEAKITAKTQYTLRLQDLLKLEQQARGEKKRPVFVVEIARDTEVELMNKEWVIIPRKDYDEIRELLPYLDQFIDFLRQQEEDDARDV